MEQNRFIHDLFLVHEHRSVHILALNMNIKVLISIKFTWSKKKKIMHTSPKRHVFITQQQPFLPNMTLEGKAVEGNFTTIVSPIKKIPEECFLLIPEVCSLLISEVFSLLTPEACSLCYDFFRYYMTIKVALHTVHESSFLFPMFPIKHHTLRKWQVFSL